MTPVETPVETPVDTSEKDKAVLSLVADFFGQGEWIGGAS